VLFPAFLHSTRFSSGCGASLSEGSMRTAQCAAASRRRAHVTPPCPPAGRGDYACAAVWWRATAVRAGLCKAAPSRTALISRRATIWLRTCSTDDFLGLQWNFRRCVGALYVSKEKRAPIYHVPWVRCVGRTATMNALVSCFSFVGWHRTSSWTTSHRARTYKSIRSAVCAGA
jgi:hypothetical protein